jgi:hypothetical protein
MRTTRWWLAFASVCVSMHSGVAGAAPASPALTLCVAGTARDSAARDRADGIALGAEEAGRTATLLGRQLRIESVGADRPKSGCTAWIVIAADTLPWVTRQAGQTPILLVDPGASDARPNLFRVRAGRGKTEWLPSLERFGASELNERFSRRFGRAMTADAWAGWVAAKAAAEAGLRSARPTGPATAESLRTLHFDGHKGVPLYFDEHLTLVQPLYDADAERTVHAPSH